MIKLSKQINYIIFLFKSIKLIPKYFKENKLTKENIKNFLQGTYRLFTFNDLDLFLREQIYFRYSRIDPTCKAKGFCYCDCEIFGLINVEKSCDKNCYPTLMDLNTWNTYKQVYSLTQEKLNQFQNNYELAKLNVK